MDSSALSKVREPLHRFCPTESEALFGCHFVRTSPDGTGRLVVRDRLRKLVFHSRPPVKDDPHSHIGPV